MLKAIKGHQLILLIVFVVFLQFIEISNAGIRRKINCRKYVHAPECRGIAAKRDTGHFFNDEQSFSPYHHDFIEYEKLSSNDNDKNERFSLLEELLQKIIDDYDN